jgi:hypothetical protein
MGLQRLLFPVGLDPEVFMTDVQARPGFAPRAMTLGALAAGATALGLLAIGWISIGKLRFFARPNSF